MVTSEIKYSLHVNINNLSIIDELLVGCATYTKINVSVCSTFTVYYEITKVLRN